MKNLKLAALALVLGSSVSLAEDCTSPAVPAVPDGATATIEQMLEGQKSVKAFQVANLAYMACLDPQLKAAQVEAKAGDEGAMETHQQLEDSYNAAVSREEELAGQFNTQLREYKAANPG